jgi:hypothetical protein
MLAEGDMSKPRGRRPVVVKNVNDLIGGILAFTMFGCLLFAAVLLFATEPAVRDCGCGRTVVTTMAERLAGMSFFGAIGLCVFGAGFSIARVRRRALQSIPESALCSRLGLDSDALRRFTEERGIQPSFVIADHPHYDLKDFGEAATLLRASAPGTSPDELLRAAHPAGPQSSKDLLHPDLNAH